MSCACCVCVVRQSPRPLASKAGREGSNSLAQCCVDEAVDDASSPTPGEVRVSPPVSLVVAMARFERGVSKGGRGVRQLVTLVITLVPGSGYLSLRAGGRESKL